MIEEGGGVVFDPDAAAEVAADAAEVAADAAEALMETLSPKLEKFSNW